MFKGSLMALAWLIGMCSGGAGSAQGTMTGPDLRAPEDGGPRRFEIIPPGAGLYATPSDRGERLARLDPQQLLGNMGCAPTAGSVWCRVRRIPGGASGYVQALHLRPATGPDGRIARGPDTSKTRARRKDFDGTTQIRCAQEQGQALGACTAAIARSGGGDATLVVTFPNGFARQLYFTHGLFRRGSATMSGVGTDMDWDMTDGLYRIRVDDQQFEVSQDFVLGQ